MSELLTEKLKTFNWKDDKPRIWPSCKFGVQATVYCMILSLIVILPAVFINFEKYFIFLAYASIVHLFSAVITIGELGEISSIQHVFIKIEPETDIISKSEQLKNDVYYLPAEWPWSLSLLLLGLICNLSFSQGLFSPYLA